MYPLRPSFTHKTSSTYSQFSPFFGGIKQGFTPVNFLFPWLPLPRNRRRDIAHIKMRKVYEGIINQRRKHGVSPDGEQDMIWYLMQSKYKSGIPVPDQEIAHMMISMLLGGQHSSASASSWIMLRLAAHPDIAQELFQEQVDNLGQGDPHRLSPLQYSDLAKLPLLQKVVKETLRLHGSIHSILRKVKNPLPVAGTPYIIGTDKVLLSSPMVTAMSEEYFPDSKSWNPHRWDHPQMYEDTVDGVVDEALAASKGTKSPYIPFGAGRHRCIGEKFAYLNLGVIVTTIVRNFKLQTMDGRVGVVPLTDNTSMFTRPVQPSLVRWTRREYN